MQNLNLKQLEVFAAVVEQGSFTAAAEQLYLAQSTVSGHITSLEKELGVTLLLRTGKRKIALTEEGRKVYTHAKVILQNCADLTRQLMEHAHLELTLAASSIPMQYLLPGYLADFSRQYPQYRFTLRGGDSDAVHRMVLDGEAQLGFAGAVLNRQALCYEPIAQDELMLIAPDTPKYRALQKSGVSGNELLGEPLIVRAGGSGTKLAVDHFLCDNRITSESIRVIARVESAQAMQQMVAQGMGVAVVSGFAARQARGILPFRLEGKSTTRQLYLLYAKGCRMTKPIQALYARILAQCAQAAE